MNLNKSKLIQLFKVLDAKEVKLLKLAINSPFFNYRKEEKNLFYFLCNNIHDSQKLSNTEEVYKNVFNSSDVNLSAMRHVMSYLTKIIVRVLTIQEFENEETSKNILLTKVLRKKNLSKHFLSQYQKTITHINSHSKLSSQKYYEQLQLHTEFYTYSIAQRKPMDISIKSISEDLDLFFVANKLKQICNIISHKNLFVSEFEPVLFDEITKLIESKNLLKNPLINLLYFSYKSLSHFEEEVYFFSLKKALFQHSKLISLTELKDIFTLTINYCIKKLNTGNKSFIKEVFEIYKLGIALKVFEEDGKISPYTFKNIVSIGIALNNLDWVYEFLMSFEHKISSEYAKDFHTYCLARYYFSINDYNKVVSLLHQVVIKETFTDLDTRVLLIKTYFELLEYDLLDYSISNFKQLIQRKKLQTYHENVYKNFAKFSGYLLNLASTDKKRIDNLLLKLNKTNAIAEKEWLMQKLKAL